MRPSPHARRITARTPMRIDGPAAGAATSSSARSPTAPWAPRPGAPISPARRTSTPRRCPQRRDPALPHRPEGLRDQRPVCHPGWLQPVRQQPASGRGRRWPLTTRQAAGRFGLAGKPVQRGHRRSAALGNGRHPAAGRRQDGGRTAAGRRQDGGVGGVVGGCRLLRRSGRRQRPAGAGWRLIGRRVPREKQELSGGGNDGAASRQGAGGSGSARRVARAAVRQAAETPWRAVCALSTEFTFAQRRARRNHIFP